MKNLRIYGTPPFTIAVVHGGPGGLGQMKPVAEELAKNMGALEPLQAQTTVQGQIDGLKNALQRHGQLPITLIGHSWGAMLGILFAATYPTLVKKLILIGSGTFDDASSQLVGQTRMNRLDAQEKQTFNNLLGQLSNNSEQAQNKIFKKLASISCQTDSYSPLGSPLNNVSVQYRVFEKVWTEAVALRTSGKFLEQATKASCPVVAIHGDYDPHPADSIKKSLETNIKDFRFILLEKCGHYPWHEKYAHKSFYEILKHEI